MVLAQPWSKERLKRESTEHSRLWELYHSTQRFCGTHLDEVLLRLQTELDISEDRIQRGVEEIASPSRSVRAYPQRNHRNPRAVTIRAIAREILLERGGRLSWHGARRVIAEKHLRLGTRVTSPTWGLGTVIRVHPQCWLAVRFDCGRTLSLVHPNSVSRCS